MAFRGFGDDALKVKADKREAALKAAQIAASERASMRSAGVQMAGLQENARQADMAHQRAGEQLAAGNERFDKQLAAGEAARAEELGLKREGMAADFPTIFSHKRGKSVRSSGALGDALRAVFFEEIGSSSGAVSIGSRCAIFPEEIGA